MSEAQTLRSLHPPRKLGDGSRRGISAQEFLALGARACGTFRESNCPNLATMPSSRVYKGRRGMVELAVTSAKKPRQNWSRALLLPYDDARKWGDRG